MSNDYQIPENIYSRELCSELYRIAQLFPEDQEIKKLLSLVRSPINGESFKIFTDDKNFTIPTIKTDNKEILARLHDFNLSVVVVIKSIVLKKLLAFMKNCIIRHRN